eukprot:gene15324-18154_t
MPVAKPAATAKPSKIQAPVTTTEQPTTPSATQEKKRIKKTPRSAGSGGNGASGSSTGGTLNKIGVVPNVTFANIGGNEHILKELREQIEFPMCHPEIYEHLGVDPPRGVLLHGPPGCGKTLLANALAGELNVPLISISAPEIASGMSGESESKIRSLFSSAIEQAPCIIFIDEIDAIASKRENASKEMERRIVAQLLTCMDTLNMKSNNGLGGDSSLTNEAPVARKSGHIIVIGATNRPESIDPALRMGGRFDKEIGLGVPDQVARGKIIKVLTAKMRLPEGFDYNEIASLTPGYVGADLNLLCKEAATFAINRFFTDISKTNESMSLSSLLKDMKEPMGAAQLTDLYIELIDFKKGAKKVQPSAKREGFATIPNVSWDDIGALNPIREELTKTILRPIKNPGQYKKMGIDSPAGVLMYGPPGCGKTLLAKAIANECQANFISVKGPELLNKYVGESERAVRQVFQRASASAPCVIFFDEFDALAPKRGSEGSQATERVVNQLLTEMDGLEKRSEVFIVAATNRPDIIDGAMLRPGRLDKLLYVPLPSPDERVEILKTLTSKIPLCKDVDLASVGLDVRCHAFSGADLSLLVKEAAMNALDKGFAEKSVIDITPSVTMSDFDYALSKTKPSVSKKDELMYDRLNLNIKNNRDIKKPKTTTTTTAAITDPFNMGALPSATTTPPSSSSNAMSIDGGPGGPAPQENGAISN